MLKRSVILIALCFAGFGSFAQNAMDQFGQNRVQFKDFDWQYYNSEHFSTYYYAGGQELGRFVVTDGEKEMADLEKTLEYKPGERISILIYNTLEDLYQSNIGLKSGLYDNVFTNTGGVARIEANKIFIYFNGDHRQLRMQLRYGLAKLLIQQMMFNGNFQEALQNNLLLNLPAWYSDGLANFLASGWTVNDDDLMRRKIADKKISFISLASEDPNMGGKTFWYFLQQKYGSGAIPNLLYLTRINRSVESGISYVTSKPFFVISMEWHDFYKNLYANEHKELKNGNNEKNYTPGNRHKALIYSTSLSSTGKIAYVMNRLGRSKVMIYDPEKKKTSTRFRTGFMSYTFEADVQSPLVSWNSTGEKLVITEERKGQQFIWIYDYSSKKLKRTKSLLSNFQKITSIAFSPYDPNTLALTAINKGQSDVYTYSIASGSVSQITNDIWDDADAHFVRLNNRTGIVFASNRPTDSLKNKVKDTLLPLGNYDIFFYNSKTKSKRLVRITNTPVTNEKQPLQLNPSYIGFLSDANGIVNRQAAWIDSIINYYNTYYYFSDSTVKNPLYNYDSLWNAQHIKPDSVKKIPVWIDIAHTAPLTDYATNITEQVTAPKTSTLVQHTQTAGKDKFEWLKVPKDSLSFLSSPPSNTILGRNMQLMEHRITDSLKSQAQNQKIVSTALPDSFSAHKLSPIYQSPFFNPVVTRRLDSMRFLSKKASPTPSRREPLFKVNRVLPYYPLFYTDQVSTQIDNTQLFSQYQRFDNLAASGQGYDNPILSGMVSAGATDLMEDYRVQAGFRIPVTFRGFEFYTALMNYKKRLDKTLIYYRKTDVNQYSDPSNTYLINARLKTNIVQLQLSYPLDYTERISGIIGYRQDKNVFLSTDINSASFLPYTQDWGLLRAEYTLDKTLPLAVNIYKGTRMKFFVEHHHSLDSIHIGFIGYGGDIRHYFLIHRNIILALRLSGASTFGGAKVVYYLGGTNNWLFPKTDTRATVSTTSGYAFQTLAAPMRGFSQNVRNGNSYALFNAELRAPIISYLLNRPIHSQFFRNFMIMGFFDAGSAWQGLTPYSDNNPYNTDQKTQGPVSVLVKYYRQPIVAGFGYGLRSTIFGYYLRLDVGWGIDNGEITPTSTTYLSIGTDF